MIFLRNCLGYCIAGLIANSVWAGFITSYGIGGGYAAAIIIIGPLWFMNHYTGLIYQKKDEIFIDMALSIGISAIIRDLLLKGTDSFVGSLPTLLLVILGAIMAGVVAGKIEKNREVKEI